MKNEEIKKELLAYVDSYKNGTIDRASIQKHINFYYNNYRYMDGREIIDMLDEIDKDRELEEKRREGENAEKVTFVKQSETPMKSNNCVQGVSVISINVVSEQDIARDVQQAINKEITKLNAQGKRVINISAGTAVKNIIGMKHHIVILWEQA